MAGAGSTACLFTKKGYIWQLKKTKAAEDAVMEIALEAGADDVKTEGETFEVFIVIPCSLEAVKNALVAKNIEIASAEVTMIPCIHGQGRRQ